MALMGINLKPASFNNINQDSNVNFSWLHQETKHFSKDCISPNQGTERNYTSHRSREWRQQNQDNNSNV